VEVIKMSQAAEHIIRTVPNGDLIVPAELVRRIGRETANFAVMPHGDSLLVVPVALTAEQQLAAYAQAKVSQAELVNYRAMLGDQYPDKVLRLVLKAHKAADRVKRLPRVEREAGIQRMIAAMHQEAVEQGIVIPEELEAVVGD
jgi:hypothetical protein